MDEKFFVAKVVYDLPDENSIAEEGYFTNPPITKYESKFQRNIHEDIGSEKKLPNFIDNIKGIIKHNVEQTRA